MKEDSGASTEDAKNAAKILATTFVQLKKDKTFTAGMGGAVTEGTWTFNKETCEVLMKISSMKGPAKKSPAVRLNGRRTWTTTTGGWAFIPRRRQRPNSSGSPPSRPP
jgi:hypothetical protein